MSKQKELFGELELYDACSRFRRCRKCDRRLHADHTERFKTRVNGLCYACLREFEESPFWIVDKFIENANTPPVIVLDLDADMHGWLKREAKRLKMPVEDVVLQIIETRRLTEGN